jgi:hypothetical protein
MSRQFGLDSIIEVALRDIRNPGTHARRFFEDRRTPKYAIGRNEDILAVHKVLPLDGLIDDYYIGEQWHGIPIIKTHQAASGSLVINGSTSIAPVTVEQALSRLPHLHAVSLHEIIAASQGSLTLPRFVIEQREEIVKHLYA